MSLASNIISFTGKTAITAADVESNFRFLVQALGGTYYTAGSSTVQAAGTLSAANFRSRAVIPNNLKSEPYSDNIIRMGWDEVRSSAAEGASVTVTAVIPLQDDFIPLGTVDLIYATKKVSLMDGSIDVQRNGVSVLSGGAQSFTGLDALTFLSKTLISPLTLKSGDILKFVLTTINGGDANHAWYGVETCLWGFSKHVE